MPDDPEKLRVVVFYGIGDPGKKAARLPEEYCEKISKLSDVT